LIIDGEIGRMTMKMMGDSLSMIAATFAPLVTVVGLVAVSGCRTEEAGAVPNPRAMDLKALKALKTKEGPAPRVQDQAKVKSQGRGKGKAQAALPPGKSFKERLPAQ
jgi:hypothetical protein